MSKRKDGEENGQLGAHDNAPKNDQNSGSGGGDNPPKTTLTPRQEKAALISTQWKTGSQFPLEMPGYRAGTKTLTTIRTDFGAPGIMVLDWVPTMGKLTSAHNEANKAWDKIYSDALRLQTGSTPFEASDLAIEQTCLDSLYTFYYDLVKVYGVVNRQSDLNDYYREELCHMLGYSYSDLQGQLANFYTDIMSYAADIASFALPGSVKLFNQHMDLASSVYRDGDSEHAQLYAFAQEYYLSYENVDKVKGITFVKRDKSSTVFLGGEQVKVSTRADIRNTWTRLYTAFKNSGDVNKINAKVKQGFGTDIHVPVLPSQTYLAPFVKDEKMLLAINNADIYPVRRASLRIADSADGNLFSNPFVPQANHFDTEDSTAMGMYSCVNFVADEPSAEDVTWATRFKLGLYPWRGTGVTEGSVQSLILTSYGTEVIVNARALTLTPWTYVGTDGKQNTLNRLVQFNTFTSGLTFNDVAVIAQFDWHPPVFLAVGAYGSSPANNVLYDTVSVSMPIVDTQNLAPLDETQLQQIHEARIAAALSFEKPLI